MHDVSEIFNNTVLWVAVAACLIAQGIKLIVGWIRDGKVTFRTLFATGGMPSAHSALVSSLATGVGMTVGWATPDFAIALLLAVIVMFDAAGVRQAAGMQARVLNQIIDELFHENKEFNEARLKELLGHTPIQVFVGVALGVTVSLIAVPAF